MNDNTNIGFTPQKVFLKDANDKIIFESFDVLNADITTADPSVKDLDVMTISLSANNTVEVADKKEATAEPVTYNALQRVLLLLGANNQESELNFENFPQTSIIQLVQDILNLLVAGDANENLELIGNNANLSGDIVFS